MVNALEAVFLFSGIAVAISSIYMVIHCWIPLPIADQWDELVSGRSKWLPWLFTQHNEHRLVTAKLVFIVDYLLDRERYRLDEILSIALLSLTAVLIIIASTGRAFKACNRSCSIGLILAFSFWAIQSDNLISGFQIQFFAVMLGSVAMFALETSTLRAIPRLGILMALMCLTTYSLASGIVACFTLVALSIYIGDRQQETLILLITAIVLICIYLYGYHKPVSVSLPILLRVPAIMEFFLAYLGAAPGLATSALSGIDAGAASIAFGAFALLWTALVLVAEGRARRRRPAFFVALIAFILLTAAVTAEGRSEGGLAGALTGRYTTATTFLWLSLFLLTCERLSRRAYRVAFVGLPIALIVASQPTFIRRAEADTDLKTAAIPALLTGVAIPGIIGILYPDGEATLARRSMLAANGTSIYALPWANWLDRPLRDHVVSVDPGDCGGSFVATELTAPMYGGWHASGQVTVAGGSSDLRLLIVDSSGSIVGYGIALHRLTDPLGVAHEWTGAFKSADPAAVSAYVLIDNHHACRIGVAKQVIHSPHVIFEPFAGDGQPGGIVDTLIVGRLGVLAGWAMAADAASDGLTIHIATKLPLRVTSAESVWRPDVARALQVPGVAAGGFDVKLSSIGAGDYSTSATLCVWTNDAEFGERILGGASAALECRR